MLNVTEYTDQIQSAVANDRELNEDLYSHRVQLFIFLLLSAGLIYE